MFRIFSFEKSKIICVEIMKDVAFFINFSIDLTIKNALSLLIYSDAFVHLFALLKSHKKILAVTKDFSGGIEGTLHIFMMSNCRFNFMRLFYTCNWTLNGL